MRIAVTGVIGAGKSTLVKRMAKDLLEYEFLSVDDMVRSQYEDPDFQMFLTEQFGTTLRSEVSALAFKDPAKLLALREHSRSMLEPAIRAAVGNSRWDVVMEFPLLYETGSLVDSFDFVINVTCDEAVQRSRVQVRDQASPEKVEAVLSAQLSAQVKACLADYTIDTTDPGQFEVQYRGLVRALSLRGLALRCNEFFKGRPQVWAAIEQAYSEPHRAYHTLDHLVSLFASFDAHLRLFAEPRAVELAIWFHDIVYDVGAAYGENESRSVAKMLEVLDAAPGWRQRLAPQEWSDIAKAAELILATKSHSLFSPMLRGGSGLAADARLFLDMDLGILGEPAHLVMPYDEAIRQEFAHVPLAKFAAARVSALQSFEARDRIFMSQPFRHLEVPARRNLGALIERWSAIAQEK